MTETKPFDLGTPEGWAQFCGLAGMKTQGLAFRMAQFEGYSVAEAVNRAIGQVVADMYEQDIPMEAIASYFESHIDYRPQLMDGVVQSMQSVEGLTDD